ncbi:MAG: ABC transporter permease [Ilumatobacteraceae bacterium]
MRRLLAQSRVELLMVLRNGEQLLLTLGIPVLLLVFFSLVDVLPTGTDEPIEFLAPGVLALAVMSTAMVSLGIGTGFERSYRVLKRLGTTPLGRGRLVAAKAASVVAVEVLQFAVIVGVAVALGWSPVGAAWAAGAGAVVLGTMAFAGVGLLLAGRLRGEINLAVQNALYLVLLLLGGMVVPIDELPSVLQTAARTLPSTALSDILHWALGEGSLHAASWPVLAAWAVVAPVAAARLFRWE